MLEKNDEKKFLDALGDLAPSAAMGLMAEGLVHNLSGVAQAIAMQADLLGMAFGQMRAMAAEMAVAKDSDRIAEFVGLIDDKNAIIDRLANKSEEMQRCLHTAASFIFSEPGSIPVIVEKLVVDELELAATDMFFKHKVKKEVVVAPDMLLLTVARHELQMALYQLIRNSIESLAASGNPDPRISIRANCDMGRARIEVEDNGSGDPEVIDRVFEPFFTTRDGHSGLGLWLARSLVIRNRGTLSCARLGPGARFIIEFEMDHDSPVTETTAA